MTAVSQKEKYDDALADVQDIIDNYKKEHLYPLRDKLEEIQTYGIEIACPELIQELANEAK